jgi:hydrogenase nickel incorporation protein HypA/HybF
MCEAILDAVQHRAAGRPVSGVRVRVGVLHRVVEPAIQTAFELVSAGTVADGAALDLVVLPARYRCARCAAATESGEPVAVCPGCGHAGLELVGGDELLLESITLAARAAEVAGGEGG